jgi:hypothetical protein
LAHHLAFPDNQNGVSERSKLLDVPEVTSTIGDEFLLPPIAIRFRHAPARAAFCFSTPPVAMPKAAMHKHCPFFRSVYDVGCARQGAHVGPEATPLFKQRFSYRLLERSVLPANGLHHPPSHALGEDIHLKP